MKYQTFVLGFTTIEALFVIGVIIARCDLDKDIQCSKFEGLSFSYLMDWGLLRTISAVGLGICAFVNAWFAVTLFFPDRVALNPYNSIDWFYWLTRILHITGYFGVALVGIFNLSTYNKAHMDAAYYLFAALSVEGVLILFSPLSKANIQTYAEMYEKWRDNGMIWHSLFVAFNFQIIHAFLAPLFAILYVVTDIGIYEWVGIFLIVLYPNWLSRDHYDVNIHTKMAKKFVINQEELQPMKSLFVQRK